MQPISSDSERRFDVVVWGASGFTGRLVVEYLAEKYGLDQDLRWAVAGRNRDKLEQVLKEIFGDGDRPSIIVADSHDRDSLQELARNTRVVLTTVGPYAKYGTELVEACVRNGTHYCDLAGEAHWIREMIDRYDEDARISGARIVMTCGFDSIPSDIGVFTLQEQARQRHNQVCGEISLLVRVMKGGPSGGTIASMLNVVDTARKDRNVARLLADPYTLNPAARREGPDGRDQSGVRYDEHAGVWTAPFIMGAINTRVVRRTNALLDYPYGREFRYRESTYCGKGFRGRLRATTLTLGLGLFVWAGTVPLTRRTIVQRLLPEPGEGPSREERENGYFNLLLVGKLPGGETMRLRVKGDRDPGYGSTSKMLAESAICLARDELDVGGGFWTPAAAMGVPLRERLTANAGLSFELE